MSESYLAEDSTAFKLTYPLENYVNQLDESTTHHEYLMALLVVFLWESGFYVLPMSEASLGENKELLYIPPKQWKSAENNTYEVKFSMKDFSNVICKLVAIPSGDRLILNFFSTKEKKKVYSLVVQSLKYVNPFSSDLSGRYINIKEIAQRFKDALATPVRSDVLTEAGLINPSLQGLPAELKLKILGMLDAYALVQISQCSHQFNELCKEPRLWKALLHKDFSEAVTESDKDCQNCYQTKHTELIKKRRESTRNIPFYPHLQHSCINSTMMLPQPYFDVGIFEGQSYPVHPRMQGTFAYPEPLLQFEPLFILKYNNQTKSYF